MGTEMEIRNIATFVKIVEYNNFTKAAESLGYSQAAVTAQIKSLEKELGIPLFDRIGRGIVLTEEGKTFLPYALNVLNAEEAARNSVQPTKELAGTLQICSPSSFARPSLYYAVHFRWNSYRCTSSGHYYSRIFNRDKRRKKNNNYRRRKSFIRIISTNYYYTFYYTRARRG